MEKKLDGQVILVTGAGRGLGASFCHVVAAAGASVLALGRDATALNALLDSLPGSGHEMVIADVTDAAAVAAAEKNRRRGLRSPFEDPPLVCLKFRRYRDHVNPR